MNLYSTDKKINFGSEKITFSLKMVKTRQEHTWSRSLALKVEKCRIQHFLHFISYLYRVYLSMEAPTPIEAPPWRE